MNSVFIHNQILYRVDGIDPKSPGQFWAEELDTDFEGTDRYELFLLKGLVDSQAKAVVLALTQVVKED